MQYDRSGMRVRPFRLAATTAVGQRCSWTLPVVCSTECAFWEIAGASQSLTSGWRPAHPVRSPRQSRRRRRAVSYQVLPNSSTPSPGQTEPSGPGPRQWLAGRLPRQQMHRCSQRSRSTRLHEIERVPNSAAGDGCTSHSRECNPRRCACASCSVLASGTVLSLTVAGAGPWCTTGSLIAGTRVQE